VITLFGYGIRVAVERGHLVLEDGIGARHKRRFPRVGHGIRRLVVIGSDGTVSLSALRWLADQDAAFVMLDRDGTVLTTSGPVRPSDARLRRAQALAQQSGAALEIARELICQKVDAQEKLVRDRMNHATAAEEIDRRRDSIEHAKTIDEVRLLESRAASAYWSAWRKLAINFPMRDLHRVPDHWKAFGARFSPLTGTPRLAANPPNAILNYLYAVLESETRLAIAALGLDPGLGVLHADSQARDSLACDVMEPIRPRVDAYLFDWISRESLRREWFFERGDGSCRLMGSFAVRLSETAPTWATAVAPIAEWVARKLWSTTRKNLRQERPATRLTQDYRREARGMPIISRSIPPPRPESFCKDCGVRVGRGRTYCGKCNIGRSTVRLVKAAEQGRVAAHTDQAEQLRADTQRRQRAARAAWQASDLPNWLTEDVYRREVQPRLKGVTLSVLASTLGVSIQYAVHIRSGRRVPHPRHWNKLADLVKVLAGAKIEESFRLNGGK
jgi:CRISPR-associated endonuclease Cas1